MSHWFVIGGSGMLKSATQGLIERGHQVSLFSRNPDEVSFDGASIHRVVVNYEYPTPFMESIINHSQQFGKPDACLVWMKPSGDAALSSLITWFSKTAPAGIFYHIKGSAWYKPDAQIPEGWTESIRQTDYRDILLGFVPEKPISRWLSHHEISEAVLKAIDNQENHLKVGVIEPWDLRP